jgi:cellulase/cellobiase CelA1
MLVCRPKAPKTGVAPGKRSGRWPSVISTLAGGNWCNPPGAGLGLRPTANTVTGLPRPG